MAAAGPARVPARAGRAALRRPAGVRRRRRRARRSAALWSPPITTRRSASPTRRRRRRSLERLGRLQHELEERDGWRIEQRVELVLVAAQSARRRARRHAVGRLAAPRAAGARAGRRSRTCCCSTSRPTISTSRRSTWLESVSRRVRRRGGVRHARPRVPAAARDAHRRARSRPADVVARRLRDVPAARRRSGSPTKRCSRRSSTRSWPRRKCGCARASRRGARATKGASRADGDARASAPRAREQIGDVRLQVERAEPSGQLVFEAEGRQQGVRRATSVVRDFSTRDHARRSHRPDRPERRRQDDAAAAAARRARAGRGRGAARRQRADRLLRPAARAARSRAHGVRHGRRRQRHGDGRTAARATSTATCATFCSRPSGRDRR